MAQKKWKRGQKNGRAKRPVRSYSDFADKIKEIAHHRGLTMEDAMEKYGGPGIYREYRKCVEEKHRELGISNAG